LEDRLVKPLHQLNHLDTNGKPYGAGRNRQNILSMDIDYGLTRRLAVNVGIPLAFGKHDGEVGAHFDPFIPFIDDGKYHGGFQDFRLGLRYRLVRDGPVAITPFIEGIVPSHRYPTFGDAAIGRNQRELLIGTNVGRDWSPLLPNAYFQARLSYAVVQRVLGMYHDRTNIEAELGYQLTERVAAAGVVTFQKYLGGLTYDVSKPVLEQWTLEQLLHHDQVLRSEILYWGGSASFRVNQSTSVFATVITTAWGKNNPALSYGLITGINKSFRIGRARPALSTNASGRVSLN
jgi:hypothetical protein